MASKVTKLFKPEAGTVHWLNDCIERGRQQPFAEVTTLTPGLANVLLANNPDNRPVRPVKVRHYANDMRRGRWPLNGETIILSREGSLNDGQNRCLAVIEANTSIPVTLFFGAERETRLTVDQGAARGAAAYLGMEGASNATTQASVARMVLAYEAEDGQSINNSLVSPTEVYDRARQDRGIEVAAGYAHQRAAAMQAYAAPAIIGFAHYALSHVDEHDAVAYLDQVTLGEALKRKDPAYTVRDRLLTIGKSSRGPKVETIFRGWNAFRQGRSLTIVKVLGNLPALV